MLTDRFGNEIKVGSTVTYPGRHGSSLWVVDGVVTGVTLKGGIKVRAKQRWGRGTERERIVRDLDRVTVVILPTPGNQHEMGS